jgi:hypothetical protein
MPGATAANVPGGNGLLGRSRPERGLAEGAQPLLVQVLLKPPLLLIELVVSSPVM